jgi:hypothetical protein
MDHKPTFSPDIHVGDWYEKILYLNLKRVYNPDSTLRVGGN